MSFTIHTQEPTTPAIHIHDEYKNDYQNALKRKLKIWAEWREDVNNVLAQGGTMEDAPPLESYLVTNDHPTENPKILLAYCASGDNITPLRKSTFLHYGIPRIKNSPTSPGSPRIPTTKPATPSDPTSPLSPPWDQGPPQDTWGSSPHLPTSPPAMPQTHKVLWMKTPKSPRDNQPRVWDQNPPLTPQQQQNGPAFNWDTPAANQARSPSPNRVKWDKKARSPRESLNPKSPRLVRQSWEPDSYEVSTRFQDEPHSPQRDHGYGPTSSNTQWLQKSYHTLPGRIGNEPQGGPVRRLYSSESPPGHQQAYAQSAILYSDDPPPDYEDRAEMLSELPVDYDRRSHEDDLQRSRSSDGSGMRYRGSVHVLDQYDGMKKTIECDFYQP